MPTMCKSPFSYESVPPGVVFIRDSNQTFFIKNGVNYALKACWDLAKKIFSSKSLRSAVAAFDKVCQPRALIRLNIEHVLGWITHLSGCGFTMFKGGVAVVKFPRRLVGRRSLVTTF